MTIATGLVVAGVTYIALDRDGIAKVVAPLAFGIGCIVGHDEAERLLRKGKDKE